MDTNEHEPTKCRYQRRAALFDLAQYLMIIAGTVAMSNERFEQAAFSYGLAWITCQIWRLFFE